MKRTSPQPPKVRPHWSQFVRGKRKERGVMNKTETAYAAHLEGIKTLGAIEWFDYEAVTFRIAKDVRYTPDFLVMKNDGVLECHEVKGFWAPQDKVRIRTAAEKFPFRFVAFRKRSKKDGGGWEETEF